MKTRWMKKSLAVLLSLVMLLGMLPMAQAAENTIDMSSIAALQPGSGTQLVKTGIPVPAELAKGDVFTYEAFLYADAAHTTPVAKAKSGTSGSTAGKAYAIGDLYTITVSGKNVTPNVTDFTVMPNGTYYMTVTMTIGGVVYEGAGEVEWAGGVDPAIDLSAIPALQQGSATRLVKTTVPMPTAMATGTVFTYEAFLYADADHTTPVAKVASPSAGSTAGKAYVAGDTYTLTMSGTNVDPDVNDFTVMPNGTYYMTTKMTIHGVVYEGAGEVEWAGGVDPALDLSALPALEQGSAAQLVKTSIPMPTAMAKGTVFNYTAFLYSDAEMTNAVAKVTSPAAGSTAGKAYVAGDAYTITLSGNNVSPKVPDFTKLENGTYYMSATMTIHGVEYTGVGEVEWNGYVAPSALDLSTATLTQNATYAARANAKFPIPAAMTKGDAYSYALALYANSDYTGKIGNGVSASTTKATKDYAVGDELSLVLVAKQEGVTIEGYDATDYSKLPNGTYYLDVSVTIGGETYTGKTAVEWNGYVGTIDLSSATLTQNATYAARANAKFPIPAAMTKGDAYSYALALYANEDYTGKIGNGVSASTTKATKDYAVGDELSLVLVAKQEGVTIEGYDATDYSKLPNGTYYLDVSVTIDGQTYKSKSPVQWNGYVSDEPVVVAPSIIKYTSNTALTVTVPCPEKVDNGSVTINTLTVSDKTTGTVISQNAGQTISRTTAAGANLVMNTTVKSAMWPETAVVAGEIVIDGTTYTISGELALDGVYKIALAAPYMTITAVSPVTTTGITVTTKVTDVATGTVIAERNDFVLASKALTQNGVLAVQTDMVKSYAGGSVKIDVTIVANSTGDSYSTSGTLTLDAYENPVAMIGNTPYTTLQAAVDAAAAGETVTLRSDVVLEDTLTIAADDEITLDLAGYTISQSKACTASYSMIANNGTLTITGNGAISFTDTGAGDTGTSWASYTIRNNGTLTVENGTIEHLGTQSGNMNNAIFNYSGSTTIEDGTISCPYSRSVRLWQGSVTINGGTFDGQVWVQSMSDCELTITGGSFKPGSKGNDGSSVYLTTDHEVTFAVEDGTFATKIGCSNTDNLTGALVTGGTFTAAAVSGTNTALLGDNMVFEENTDGSFGVADAPAYVAEVDGTSYTSLQTAIDAADGKTVTLLSDVTVDADVTVNGDVMLDLASFDIIPANDTINLNIYGKLTIDDSVGGGVSTFRNHFVRDGGELVIEDGTIQNIATATGGFPINTYDGNATVTINGGTVQAVNTGNYAVSVTATSTLTINDGTIKGNWGCVHSNGTVVINDGYFEVTGTVGGHCVYGAAGTITIKGGEFTPYPTTVASYAVYADGTSAVTIEGGIFHVGNSVMIGKTENASLVVTGGTYDRDVNAFCADGYAALTNLDGQYVVGKLPTATVNDLGAMTIPAGEYGVWNGSSYTGTSTEEMPLSFVMQFKADETAADVANSPYADWYGDFVITFEGIEGGQFTADGCYLAGYYGDFGWVKVPVDGLVIEDGVRYPVMLGVGLGQKYDYICSGVETFQCALYITPEILAANPNLEVSLNLSVVDNSKGSDAAAEALVKNENVYEVVEEVYEAEDFAPVVAEVNGTEYKALQAAIDAAAAGDTVNLLTDIELTAAVAVAADDEVVINLNGFSISGAAAFDVAGKLTINGTSASVVSGTITAAADATVAITGGTYAQNVNEFCAAGYVALTNLDGQYIVGTKPTATVNDLGAKTIPAGEYGIWDGKSYTSKGTEDLPLSFVMQFLADQTETDMDTSPYSDWYGDFVITFEGIEGGQFTADGCYLAGYYGDFGWVKVPVDGMIIEDGVRYPVMLGVGLGQKYDYICSGVEEFQCALYLTPEILDANPNMNVELELTLVDNSKGSDAAAEALVKNENVYEVVEEVYEAEDFVPSAAMIGDVKYDTIEAAMAAAVSGDTVKLMQNVSTSTLMVIPGVTVDLNGKTLEATYVAAFGKIIDSADGKGLLKTGNITMTDSTASYLPVYNAAEGGYRFFQYTFALHKTGIGNVTENSAMFACTLSFTNKDAWAALIADDDSVDITMNADLGDGTTLVFSFGEIIDEGAAADNGANNLLYYFVTLNGLSNLAGKTIVVTPTLTSGNLHSVSAADITYAIPA